MAKATTITELRQNSAGLKIIEALKILKIELKDNYSIKQIAHIAICVNNLPLLQSIYQHCDKGEINAFDEQKITILHIAVVKCRPAICLFLINKQKVDISVQDKNGLTALHYAIIQDMHRIVTVLINQGAKTNILTDKFNSCLHLAVEHSSRKLVKKFVKEGNDVNGKNISGLTPLHLAVAKGDTKLAKLLLDNGAEIESLDTNNDTPLFIAAINGRYKTLDFLIKNKANIFHINNKGQNILHKILYGHAPDIEIIEYLVEQNVDLRLKDYENLIPLHFAALNSMHSCFDKVLLLFSKLYCSIDLIKDDYPPYQIKTLLIYGDVDQKILNDLTARDTYIFELNFAHLKNYLFNKGDLKPTREIVTEILKSDCFLKILTSKFNANLYHLVCKSQENLHTQINKMAQGFIYSLKLIDNKASSYLPLSLKTLAMIKIIQSKQYESAKHNLPQDCVDSIAIFIESLKNKDVSVSSSQNPDIFVTKQISSVELLEIQSYCHLDQFVSLSGQKSNIIEEIIDAANDNYG